MQTKIAWRPWTLSLTLILIVLVGVSFLIDVNTIGATGRFAWNAAIAALLISARGWDTVLVYVLRRRIWRVTSFFTGIGLGYSGNVILIRMRYLCAWRLWKYDPRYRDPSGELWVSVMEPIKLWKERKLDRYVGHPLFARKQVERAAR